MSDTPLDIQVLHAMHTALGPMQLDLSLTLQSGSITALTGPSGAGKTTILRILAGLIKPQQGYIHWKNETWLDTKKGVWKSPQNRNTGLVFQDYALFPHLTIKQNIAFGLNPADDSTRVDDLLEEMELSQLAHQKPQQLSGGQQQRVALARALARRPPLLLLDEPLSALDRGMRQRMQDFLLEIHQKYQQTIVLVTHDPAEIFRMADQVVELEQGKIKTQGTPEAVFTSQYLPADGNALLAEVLSCHVEADGVTVKALIDQRIHTIRLSVGQAAELRPGSLFLLRYSLDSPQIMVVR
ncbi:sulfate/molybdate ABC transporter ATP-binding protein [Arundinibacter roseus]|uniref:ATP-binding cassette domain-containing protein n=1 Tax=Arundinibacter roseus TaxID=2070510 RepID=A0A4R4K1Z0_9BACT|nr:ATP-binding cassette domain-containing protein [Arundinibacter roseus]TDB60009.1 ATP-binding cassette domain-containing protein [Arundinibacter roseus]